jgi:enterochelin esterase-like enzyme
MTDPRTMNVKSTATAVHAALESSRTEDLAALADRLRDEYGEQVLSKGLALVQDFLVVWLVFAPGLAEVPSVVSEVGAPFRIKLTRLAASHIYAATRSFDDGAAFRWRLEISGEARPGGQVEVYGLDSDTREQPGVLRGKLHQQAPLESPLYPHTKRDWWIYVPAQYTDETAANTMIFLDGASYLDCIPITFDNLIGQKHLPPTICVFVEPGKYGDTNVSNRQLEYDTVSDRYSRLLVDELLPAIAASYNVRGNPESRAIAGFSSGSACAFTVAWHRPDQFSRVLSWAGSFTHMGPYTYEQDLPQDADPEGARSYLANFFREPANREGADRYSRLIRLEPKKQIRIFLQAGSNDLDIQYGNWYLANQEMAKALEFAGYDYQLVSGAGFHSQLHGRAILPAALRWLWREQ